MSDSLQGLGKESTGPKLNLNTTMILFNTTFAVDSNHAADFIAFIRDSHIPAAEKSGLYGMLLTEMHGEATTNSLTGQHIRTFALQMRAPSADIMSDFHERVLPSVYAEIGRRWGMAVCMFESQLDVVYDHQSANGRKG